MPNVVLQSGRFQTKLITRRPFAIREEPLSGNSSTSCQKRRPSISTKLATNWSSNSVSSEILFTWNHPPVILLREQASRSCYFVLSESERHTTSWWKRQSGMKKEISFSLKMMLLMSFCFYLVNMVYCLLHFICFMCKEINTMYFSVCLTCLSWCRVCVDMLNMSQLWKKR